MEKWSRTEGQWPLLDGAVPGVPQGNRHYSMVQCPGTAGQWPLLPGAVPAYRRATAVSLRATVAAPWCSGRYLRGKGRYPVVLRPLPSRKWSLPRGAAPVAVRVANGSLRSSGRSSMQERANRTLPPEARRIQPAPLLARTLSAPSRKRRRSPKAMQGRLAAQRSGAARGHASAPHERPLRRRRHKPTTSEVVDRGLDSARIPASVRYSPTR
jgi:hypothetical protein